MAHGNSPKSTGHWPSYGLQLADNLRRLRGMRGLSQGRLAVLAGVSRNVVSNLERNENSADRCADPVMSTVYKLARALHVPPAVLMPAANLHVDGICGADPLEDGFDMLWPTRPEDTSPFSVSYRVEGRPGQRPEFEDGAPRRR